MKKKKLIFILITSVVILSLFLASSLPSHAALAFETREFTFTVDELVRAFQDNSVLYVVDRTTGELVRAEDYGFQTHLFVANYNGRCVGCWQAWGMDYSQTDFVIDLTLRDLAFNVNQMSLTSWNGSGVTSVPSSTSIAQQILGTYVRVGNVDYNQEYFYSDTVWYDYNVPVVTYDSNGLINGYTNSTRLGKFTKLGVDYNAGWNSDTKSPDYMVMNRLTLEYRKYGDVSYSAANKRNLWFELSEITGTEVLLSDQLSDETLGNIENILGNVDQGLKDDYLVNSSTSDSIINTTGNTSLDINEILLDSREIFDIPLVEFTLDVYEDVVLVQGFQILKPFFASIVDHPAIVLIFTYSMICVVASYVLFSRKA